MRSSCTVEALVTDLSSLELERLSLARRVGLGDLALRTAVLNSACGFVVGAPLPATAIRLCAHNKRAAPTLYVG